MTDEGDAFAGALIHVIDDEATQRLLTRDCLEEASGGPDGLDRIRKDRLSA